MNCPLLVNHPPLTFCVRSPWVLKEITSLLSPTVSIFPSPLALSHKQTHTFCQTQSCSPPSKMLLTWLPEHPALLVFLLPPWLFLPTHLCCFLPSPNPRSHAWNNSLLCPYHRSQNYQYHLWADTSRISMSRPVFSPKLQNYIPSSTPDVSA